MRLLALFVAGCTAHAGPTIAYRPTTGQFAYGVQGGVGVAPVEAVVGFSKTADKSRTLVGVQGRYLTEDRGGCFDDETLTCTIVPTIGLGLAAGGNDGIGLYGSLGADAWATGFDSLAEGGFASWTTAVTVEARWLAGVFEIAAGLQVGGIVYPVSR